MTVSHSTHNRSFRRRVFPGNILHYIDYTGTDNQTITKKKYTKYKIADPNTTKLALVKHRLCTSVVKKRTNVNYRLIVSGTHVIICWYQ